MVSSSNIMLVAVKKWQSISWYSVSCVVCSNAEEFESERLSASMRAEKAEASAIAAQHELIDVTKR